MNLSLFNKKFNLSKSHLKDIEVQEQDVPNTSRMPLTHQLFKLRYNKPFSPLKMARNSEKAQAMLNRWWTMKRNLVNKQQDERPKGLVRIRQITDVQQCEKWRKQVTRQIITNVQIIQNRALGQARIRQVNDDINKQLRQLYHWQIRIKELGGADHKMIKGAKMYDAQGYEIPGFGGYRYFGAAKDLPGVREVFRREAPTAPEKTSQQIRKIIDEEYFGEHEALNEELLREEKTEQELKREASLVDWIEQNKKKIDQYFKGREPDLTELMDNIDNIEDSYVQLEQ